MRQKRANETPIISLEEIGPILLDFIYEAISNSFEEGNLRFPPALTAISPLKRVNVTVRVAGEMRGSRTGEGSNLLEQALNAAIEATRDEQFSGPIVECELNDLTVELWLEVKREKIKPKDLVRIRLGIDGAELQIGDREAYYVPSIALLGHLAALGQCSKAWRGQQICQKPHGAVPMRLSAARNGCTSSEPQGDHLADMSRCVQLTK